MSETARAIGPYSRPNALAKLDGRTKEAALIRQTRTALLAHVGTPSATQRALVERAVMLTLHCALFDRRALEAGGLSERDGKSYLAYSNALARTLRALGLKGAAPAPPTLAEIAAGIAAARNRDAAA